MKTFCQFISEARERKIGKEIGGELYLHKDYEHLLPQEELSKAKSFVPHEHLKKYNVTRYNKKSGSFAFIHSPDFDSAHEPISGDSVKVDSDGATKLTKQKKDPQIWHHKWQWVGDDYKGFDVNQSKKRSNDWKPITDKMKEGEDPMVMKKIGTQSYWEKNVLSKMK
jgi:hypothetical protein